MEHTYRWGILGPGRIAEKFAAALNYTEGAELFAVASRDGSRAKQFAEKYGATRVYDDYVKLVRDAEVDIIYIATPHPFHCEQAILCLENKKAVLCEKPMALDFQEVSRMADTARNHRIFLMEGMWSRFMPSINKVLELIKQDILGPIQYVRADFGFQSPYDPNGRLYNLELGGGSLLDVGIYPLYLATLLLGEPVNIQSMARLASTGADEYCSIQLQYGGGGIACIFSAITIKTALTAEIAGPKGRIYLHAPFYKANSITLEDNNGWSQNFSFPHELNGFEYEIREVMNCLDKGYLESPLLPLDLSLLTSRIMDTVRAQCGIIY